MRFACAEKINRCAATNVDPATAQRAIYIDEIREAERFANAAPTSTLTAGVLQ